MNIQELLQSWLVSLYNSGKTDEELAKMAGTSRPHINRLRHGTFPFEKVKLETLLRLFPNMRIELGDTITTSHSAVNNGTNNGSMTVNNQTTAELEPLKSALRSAILKSDMCSDCKVKILTMLESC